ncbi:MAG: sulfur carrier protein ThiS [Myxococcales bacterium]|nr:sulfur carrier protein ThiS [Myxococcales bacterium]
MKPPILEPACSAMGADLPSRPMQLVVNGEERQVGPNTTVKELLASLGLADTLVAVERNEEVVPRAQHESTELREGDRVEVVHFVGGG